MTSPTGGVMCVSEDQAMFQRVMEEFNNYEQAVSCNQTRSLGIKSCYLLCRRKLSFTLNLITAECFRN